MGPNHRHKHTVPACRSATTSQPHAGHCGRTLSARHTTACLLITLGLGSALPLVLCYQRKMSKTEMVHRFSHKSSSLQVFGNMRELMRPYFRHISCNRLWRNSPDESCSAAANPRAMLNLPHFSHTARS